MKLLRCLVVLVGGCVVYAGCAAPEQSPGRGPDLRGGEPVDLAGVADRDEGAHDLATTAIDLAADLGVSDLSVASDLARDLAMPRDFAGVDLIVCNPPVAGSACDTSPQCGCAGGLNCSVTDNSTGATSCVAAGSTALGFACSGSGAGQCRVGATCVDGVCQSYCDSAGDCGGAYHECGQVSNGSGTAIPGFKTCTQLCNPIAPADATAPFQPCGPGIGCLPGPAGASSCFGPTRANAQQGDDCSDDIFNPQNPDFSQCAPGQLCLSTTFGPLKIFSCARFCRKALGDGDCVSLNSDAGTYSCYSFSTKQYAGAGEIGYCN